MVPSVSAALALIVTDAGAVKLAPAAGAVRLTVGSLLDEPPQRPMYFHTAYSLLLVSGFSFCVHHLASYILLLCDTRWPWVYVPVADHAGSVHPPVLPFTVTLTTPLVPVAPWLSVATAVRL